jgi:hypothetical protein
MARELAASTMHPAASERMRMRARAQVLNAVPYHALEGVHDSRSGFGCRLVSGRGWGREGPGLGQGSGFWGVGFGLGGFRFEGRPSKSFGPPSRTLNALNAFLLVVEGGGGGRREGVLTSRPMGSRGRSIRRRLNDPAGDSERPEHQTVKVAREFMGGAPGRQQTHCCPWRIDGRATHAVVRCISNQVIGVNAA